MNPSLEKFKEINNSVLIKEDHGIALENLWEDNTFICHFPDETDFSALENIYLPPTLSAIHHVENKFIEYIWGAAPKAHQVINRKFKFIFLQKEFEAEFTSPSEALVLLAKGFILTAPPSETEYRNLRDLNEYYTTSSTFLKDYYKDKVPSVFKISGNFENKDLIALSKNLNFYIRFFDRFSPFILIFDKFEKQKYKVPCLSDKAQFPEIISVHKIDPVLVDLFEVARKPNNARLRFLFYYQVLEYCSYYHLNETLKKRLTNIIKRPDLLSNSLEYGRLITEEFKDYFKTNDDSQKMERLLADFISPNDIRLEIETHFDFFSKSHKFDGDFTLEPLISDLNELNLPNKDFIKKVKTQLEKIRNVLVHIRENRENKVILPTEKNSNLLIPYLYLIQRIAEYAALNYEQ